MSRPGVPFTWKRRAKVQLYKSAPGMGSVWKPGDIPTDPRHVVAGPRCLVYKGCRPHEVATIYRALGLQKSQYRETRSREKALSEIISASSIWCARLPQSKPACLLRDVLFSCPSLGNLLPDIQPSEERSVWGVTDKKTCCCLVSGTPSQNGRQDAITARLSPVTRSDLHCAFDHGRLRCQGAGTSVRFCRNAETQPLSRRQHHHHDTTSS